MNKETLKFNMLLNEALIQAMIKLKYKSDGTCISFNNKLKIYKSNDKIILRFKRMRKSRNYLGNLNINHLCVVNNCLDSILVSTFHLNTHLDILFKIILNGQEYNTGVFLLKRSNDYEIETDYLLSLEKLISFKLKILEHRDQNFTDNEIIKPLYENENFDNFNYSKILDYLFNTKKLIMYDDIIVDGSLSDTLIIKYKSIEEINDYKIERKSMYNSLEGNVIPLILVSLLQYTACKRGYPSWSCYKYRFIGTDTKCIISIE